jgi:lysozyme family protein
MSTFDKAIDFVLDHEGGFVDHPSDPGGATNFGVSLRTLKQLESNNLDVWDLDYDGDIDADDMRLITKDMAKEFYETHFWHHQFEGIYDQAVATKLFDMCVNMGTRQAVKLLQRACNWNHQMLKVDGIIGPHTLNVVNSSDCIRYFIISTQAKFYYQLVDAKPSRGVFLLGWLRRAYSWPET